MAYLTDPDALPEATRAAIAAAPDATIPEGMNILRALSEEVRSLPQVTLGKLAGFARGAGNEFFHVPGHAFRRDRQVGAGAA
ncbi:hypothetical protein ACH4KU_06015 [Streptomyces althioticus]|uniref:hypothetical protein n=1 Tax=Streptomyces TaxID=1883 RepID=UPI0033E86579